MTRDEILRLEGQELVEAVATDVMGYNPAWVELSHFNPLTNENHLAEVREKMVEKNLVYDFSGGLTEDGEKLWYGRFKSKIKYIRDIEGPSYALTLLRAALLALNQEEEK